MNAIRRDSGREDTKTGEEEQFKRVLGPVIGQTELYRSSSAGGMLHLPSRFGSIKPLLTLSQSRLADVSAREGFS